MKRCVTAALAALCRLSLASCSSPGSPAPAGTCSSAGSSSSQQGDTSSSDRPGPTPTVRQIAKERVAAMTLEEKVGQLFFVRCPADDAVSDVSKFHLGGYLLFGRDTKDKTADDLIQTIADYQTAAGDIPLLIGTDEEGGTVVRVSSNPNLRSEKFRSPQQLYQSGGIEAVTEDAHRKDLLLQALGFNVNFAPVADVSTNPGDFIYDRSFGQGAEPTASYVAAVVSRMHRDGMGSVLKHFPGYGNNVDTHTGIAVDKRSLRTFLTTDFLPFRVGITAGDGTAAVLVSHNIMESVDQTLPSSLSPAVHVLLRQELGFDGVAMTDDLAMEAVSAYAADGSVAVLALKAGNDMVLTSDYRTQIPQVIDAVNRGDLAQRVIDTACARVLIWKMSLGLL